MVSTNRVYRLTPRATPRRSSPSRPTTDRSSSSPRTTTDCTEPTSCSQGGPYENGSWPTPSMLDGRPYLFYDGEMWVVFYEEVPRCAIGSRRCSSSGQVDPTRRPRSRRFHRACAEIISRMIPAPSKTAKSDAVNLYEMLGSRNAGEHFGLDRSRLDLVQAAHAPVPPRSPRDRLRLLAEDAGARSTGTSATSRSGSRPTTPTRSTLLLDGGTTTGSGSSRGCSTSTSCRGCRRAPGIGLSFTYGSHTLLEPRFRHLPACVPRGVPDDRGRGAASSARRIGSSCSTTSCARDGTSSGTTSGSTCCTTPSTSNSRHSSSST